MMHDEGCALLEFIFYWFLIQTRKNEEKVVGVKSDTDVNCIVQIIVVIIMSNKRETVNETNRIVCDVGRVIFHELG